MNIRVAIFFVFSFQILHAQTSVMDSLTHALTQNTREDTIKVSLLTTLSFNAARQSPQKGFEYAQQALQLAEKLNYTRGIADAYKEITRYYWSQTDYNKAADYAHKAIKEYERINYQKGVSWGYSMIGLNYSQGNDYVQALNYLHRSLDLNKKIGNDKGIAGNLNSIGYIYELKKEYETSLQYYKEALQRNLSLNDPDGLSLSYNNVGSAYTYTGKYTLALEYLLKSLAIAEKRQNKNYIALNLQYIGEVYYKTGKYIEGERKLQTALAIANDIGDKKRLEGVYEVLKNLEESRHNYLPALRYLEKLQTVRDTLYTQARSRQMAEMSARYETDKKEQTIKLLEQEQRIHALWRNVLAGGIFIAALVGFIIYRLQRSRTQKTTQLLEVQQSLNDKLKEVDKIKSRFFANVSHEFRTPLTLLLAPIEEKLLANNVSCEEKKHLTVMKRNANRLLDLVNQLLDLSKLEARKMQLRVKAGNLKDFVNIIASSFDSLADHRKINFEKNISLPSGEYWYDADVLEKVMNNLLFNALKFTPAYGSVLLSVHSETSEADKKRRIKVQVKDTGKGIPQAEQRDIFSPFYQVKNTGDGEIGTGLGLSLVKEFVSLYNGSIDLVSHENMGTTITLLLPAEKDSFSPEQIVEGFAHDHKKTYAKRIAASDVWTGDEDDEYIHDHNTIVLVVEDNADLRNFMASILQQEYSVITAVNGKEGMEQAVKHMPGLIVSDVMMPVMDGISLTEKIKTDENTCHIPIILLTAKNEIESRIEGLKTGADDYLTKPFSTEELRVRIANLIEQRTRLAAKYRNHITVLPTSSEGVSMEEKFLQKVKTAVETSMGDCDFCVDNLADQMNLSRTQLLRKMKALTGLSPNDFIKDMRMKKAAELIATKVDTITQISYMVGFADQSYFTKCFKKQYGVAPSDYAAVGKELVNR